MTLASTVLLAALAARAAAGGEAEPVYALHPAIDAVVMGVSALGIAVPSLLASEIIHPSCPCDPASVNSFDRGAIGNHDAVADTASDVTALVAMGAPPLLDWLVIGRGPALESDVAVFAEALLVNGALVEAAKYAVQRPLPRTYAGDPSLVSSPGGYRSFYSGHTSTTFAALTAAAFTVRARYGERVWPWLVAGGVGTSVAVERVAAGRHFPTDVLVGAVAGTAVGLAVPWLHLRHPEVHLVPAGDGLAIVGTF